MNEPKHLTSNGVKLLSLSDVDGNGSARFEAIRNVL